MLKESFPATGLVLSEVLLIFRMVTLLSFATPNESLEDTDSPVLAVISTSVRALLCRQGAPGFDRLCKLEALMKNELDICTGSCTECYYFRTARGACVGAS